MPNSPQNKARLFDELIAEYCAHSFGALSKKEVDLLVFRLLIDTGAIDLSDGQQSISRTLRIPISKVKSLIYEIQLRDERCDNAWFRREVLAALQHARFHIEGKRQEIQLGIESPMLRKELEAAIKKQNSFADYSFNSEILRIDFNVYASLLEQLITDQNDRTKLEAAIKAALKKQREEVLSWKELLNAFLKGAAGKAGEEIVDLTFGYFTGGATHFLKTAKSLLS